MQSCQISNSTPSSNFGSERQLLCPMISQWIQYKFKVGCCIHPHQWCIIPPWYSKLWVTVSKDWEQAMRGALSKVLVPTLLHLVWDISVAFNICHRKRFFSLGSAHLHSFLHSFDVKSLATLFCPLLVIWIHLPLVPTNRMCSSATTRMVLKVQRALPSPQHHKNLTGREPSHFRNRFRTVE